MVMYSTGAFIRGRYLWKKQRVPCFCSFLHCRSLCPPASRPGRDVICRFLLRDCRGCRSPRSSLSTPYPPCREL